MSPRSSALLAVALALAASPARSQGTLEVGGEVLATDPRLEVRVVVTNRGPQPTGGLDVSGEWQQQRDAGRIAAGLAPGASGSVVLGFEVGLAAPGVHALPLLLEHPLDGARDAGGNAPVASERAWLLVALEQSTVPDVKLLAEPARIGVRGQLAVGLSSLDGRPHRVLLRAFTARGLRVEGDPPDVEVPAAGTVQVQLSLMRAGATRGSQHGVLLVAESRERPLRTTVAVAQVKIDAEAGLLPRYRRWLLGLGVVLMGLALGSEVWRALRGRAVA